MVERGGGVKREDGDGEKALLFKESSVMTHEDSHPIFFSSPGVFLCLSQVRSVGSGGWKGVDGGSSSPLGGTCV